MALAAAMRRRDFIKGIGGTAGGWPLAAMAQQVKSTRRIGVLMGLPNDAEAQVRIRTFEAELARLGWTEGQSVQIDYRFGVGGADRVRDYAGELIGANRM